MESVTRVQILDEAIFVGEGMVSPVLPLSELKENIKANWVLRIWLDNHSRRRKLGFKPASLRLKKLTLSHILSIKGLSEYILIYIYI